LRNNYPKTEVRVRVVRIVVVAKRRPRVVLIVVPRATAQRTSSTCPYSQRISLPLP